MLLFRGGCSNPPCVAIKISYNMKTIEEMAYGYACNKLVPNAQHDNSAEIASLQNTLIDFTQKVLVEYNRWYDPKEELPPDDMEVLC